MANQPEPQPGRAPTDYRVAKAGEGDAAATLRIQEAKTQPPGGRAAVLVVHGMGQPVPFTTIEDVAEALRDANGAAAGQKVTARTVKLGKQKLQRAEVAIGRGAEATEVHVYEAYWAPITEGAIDLRGVMGFLLRAGWSGSLRMRGPFRRWMFGDEVEVEKKPTSRRALRLALLTLGSLVAFNALVALVAGAFLAPGLRPGWLSDAAVKDVSLVMLALLLLLGLFALVLLRPRRLLRKGKEKAARRWSRFGNGFLVVACLAFPLAALGSGAILVLDRDGGSVLGFAPTPPSLLLGAALAVLWAILLGASWFIRGRVVQYVGDVAVYISPQYLDAYAEKRAQIKECVRSIGAAIYAEPGPDGKGRLYDRVAIVGHSLGSVIAYDTLNGLLNDDALAGKPDGVQKRTRLLLTFGSPLEKTAFLFGVRGRSGRYLREALAASVQPLIEDYGNRKGLRWVNVHSPSDIVSGRLNAYDDPRKAPPGCAVQNEEDPRALSPILAHLEYWKNPATWGFLREALLGSTPPPPPPGEAVLRVRR